MHEFPIDIMLSKVYYWELMKKQDIVGIIAIIFVLSLMLFSFVTQIPSADELVFTRVTEHLPSYACHLGWFSLDSKTDPNTYLIPNTFFEKTFEVPVWIEPPLTSYLTYPIVKLVFSENNVTESIHNLRIIAWLMFVLILIGLFVIVKRQCKLDSLMLSMPLFTSIPFFITWSGSNWWYYDVFMLLFLVIALLIRNTKYQNLIYIPLTLMVATKMIGLLFLIPFIIENRKTVICILGIVPYVLLAYYLTGDWSHIISIWLGIGGEGSFIIIRINTLKSSLIAAAPLLLILAVPIYQLIKDSIKKHWFVLSLFVCVSIYGLAWTFAYYHLMPMIFIGILIMGEYLALKKEVSNYPSNQQRGATAIL
jgi:hypothetical protein